MKKISIEYCKTCNYGPIAASLSVAIRNALDLRPELIASPDTGCFEVTVDGKLIFSKKETRKFPDHGEIVRMLATWEETENK